MALPAWPAQLPLPQIQGNSLAPADRSARVKEATRNVWARQRFSHILATCPVSWVCSGQQFSILHAWWWYTLHQGAAWFTITLRGELGATATTARMSDGYTAALVGPGRWKITATLDLDNPPHQVDA